MGYLSFHPENDFDMEYVTLVRYRVKLSTSALAMFKTSSDYISEEDKQVRALVAFSRGFAYSCKSGYVHMFEQESPSQYRKRNVFKIVESADAELNVIKHLSINVSQDKLLATTNRAQIFTVRLWGPDIHVVSISIVWYWNDARLISFYLGA